MKRVLFDENIPRKLRLDLPEYVVRTVQEQGWGTYRNGELLRRAEESFDVLITADRRMQYQQTLSNRAIGIVVLVTPRLRLQTLRTAVAALRSAVAAVKPGEVVHVHVGMRAV
ncbi:MAG TPA: DUF5615 family PIN-like protein [Thermoanaerobaculia bacterium]|nr:DUF5615 family PIN-like protein [Thermoanaerobaculia bacterium]